jgi:hypothetical protein
MGGLPDDVLQFVERRFAHDNRPVVCGALETAAVSTPRVMRAVLYLSDGSLSRLRHYVEECEADVRGILTSAEYADDATQGLVPVRDMSLPFPDERNLGADYLTRNVVVVRQHAAPARQQPTRPATRSNYHSYLVRRSFTLGQAMYLVRRTQTHPDRVSCYRKSGTVVRLVSLPLHFVLEQLAERIDLEVTTV